MYNNNEYTIDTSFDDEESGLQLLDDNIEYVHVQDSNLSSHDGSNDISQKSLSSNATQDSILPCTNSNGKYEFSNSSALKLEIENCKSLSENKNMKFNYDEISYSKNGIKSENLGGNMNLNCNKNASPNNLKNKNFGYNDSNITKTQLEVFENKDDILNANNKSANIVCNKTSRNENDFLQNNEQNDPQVDNDSLTINEFVSFVKLDRNKMEITDGIARIKTLNVNKILYPVEMKISPDDKTVTCPFISCNTNILLNNNNIRLHLNQHMLSYSIPICAYCTAWFEEPMKLHYHLDVHKDEKDLLCVFCEDVFVDANEMKIHLQTHMDVELMYKSKKCGYCDKNFPSNSKSVIDYHLYTCVKRRFVCSECNLSFVDQPNLNIHLKMHKGSVPFPCPICKRLFINKKHLTRHIKSHTSCKHKCHVCYKTFSSNLLLTKHFRLHSNPDFKPRPFSIKNLDSHDIHPFNCQLCSKTFKVRKLLKQHINIHINPHICCECSRPFSTIAALKAHFKRYHKDKYLCTKCPKISFVDENEYKAHVWSIHKVHTLDMAPNVKVISVSELNCEDSYIYNDNTDTSDFEYYEFDIVG